jgi:cystathionine beta-lyase/cystathionine gamma-synthase
MNINEILNHLGEERENYFNAVSPPIIQSSNFAFDAIDDLRNKILNESSSHVYTRGNNPTVEILRKKVAALENAEDALIVGSGASAISAAVISQVKSGDHIICVNKPYSWTYKLINNFLSRFNVAFDFVDGEDLDQIKASIRPNTKVLMLESPNSLTFEIQDLKACATICRENGITSIIDNSHCSPYFQNPIDHGIDIVVHSATKYLCGHSDVVMGVICSRKEIIEQIFKSEMMTLGLTISPNDAFLGIRGLRTLALRMDRTEQSGKIVFAHLAKHPKVRKIYYPLDPMSNSYDIAIKQMSGCGGLISIELDTDSKASVTNFHNALDKFICAVSWGGHESLKMPSLAFHDMPGQEDSPIPFQTVRLYIGLEDPNFLIENLDKALNSF